MESESKQLKPIKVKTDIDQRNDQRTDQRKKHADGHEKYVPDRRYMKRI